MKRQNKHVKKRRELGKCAREGCAVSTGDRYYCDVHAEYQRIRSRKYRAAKAAREAALAAQQQGVAA